MRFRTAFSIGLFCVAVAVLWQKVTRETDIERIDIGESGYAVLSRSPESNRAVLHIESDSVESAVYALGYAHARDRLVQMVLLRSVASGHLSRDWMNTKETNRIDVAMKEFEFLTLAKRTENLLSKKNSMWLNSYSDGVNRFLATGSLPLEFRLVGLKPEAWRPSHTIISALAMTSIGLADSQLGVQGLIIESITSGNVSLSHLQTIFAPHLDSLDNNLKDLLSRVNVRRRILPDSISFGGLIPTTGVAASNCWAISGSRSSSGKPMQCNDPHLEIGRLPAIWHQVRLSFPSTRSEKPESVFGISMPGIPLFLMGRNRHLSFGFTYGMGDQIDLFIEEVKNGKYRVDTRNEDGEILDTTWHDLEQSHEVIERQGETDLKITIFRTRNGVLELDYSFDDDQGSESVRDGLYLSRAFSVRPQDLAKDIGAIFDLSLQHSVNEAMPFAQRAPVSTNWILADSQGNIGYQQGGHLPSRRNEASALLPVTGWEDDNIWYPSLLQAEHFVSILNPPNGILVSSNNDVEDVLLLGSESDQKRTGSLPLTIGISMGPERANRIQELLLSKPKLSLDDMKKFQSDTLYPLRLRSGYLDVVSETIESRCTTSEAARSLRDWDGHMDADSVGAYVFSKFREAACEEVFGKKVFGQDAWLHIKTSTNFVAVFGSWLDRYMQNDAGEHGGRKLNVFDTESRPELFTRVLGKVLTTLDKEPRLKKYGEYRQFYMRNILFKDKLPFSSLGFNHGPVPGTGSEYTVVQAQVFNRNGIPNHHGQSWRYVSDLATTDAYSSLPGGPSGNRFSELYKDGVDDHFAFRYRLTRLD